MDPNQKRAVFCKERSLRIHPLPIPAIITSSSNEGIALVGDLLSDISDKKTAFFLSGGKTPKDLYGKFAQKNIAPGAVAMVDERFGEKFHQDSNEIMMKETGLLSFLEKQGVPFYPVLENKDIETTSKDYDETVRYLLGNFPHSVGVLGIGVDGHTAGLPANPDIWEKDLLQKSKNAMVSWYNDTKGFYKERITMTFQALSQLSFLLVLAFGEEKKEALAKIFKDGDETEIPGRFFKREDISNKTLLITDQEV